MPSIILQVSNHVKWFWKDIKNAKKISGRSVQVKFDDEALHTDRPIKSKIKVRFDTSDEDSSCVYKDLGRTMIKVKEGKKGFLDTAAFKILYDKASWEMRSQNPWTE